jgi:type I restriction enzyme S subunit
MELMHCFIKTEVGVIPNDWRILELGEICSPSKSRINPVTSNQNYKCIELEHLSQGTGRLLGHAQSKNLLSQKTLFKKGDILFGKLRPYLKKFLLTDFDGVCTTEIWALKTAHNISNKFLYQLVQSDRIIEAANISTGTKMPRAEWKTVSETKVPLPPTLQEQIAIATVLNDTDAFINNLEKIIAKKRDIKQGAMQELLKPKKGWRMKKLGEVGTVIRGSSPRPQGDKRYYGGSIPRLMVEDVTRDGKLVTPNVDFLTEEGAKKSRPCKKGTLTIVCSGTVGIVSILAVDACIHDGFLALINIKNRFSTDYLYHKLSALRNQFENSATHGGIFTNLTTSSIRDFETSFPPIESQIEIAKILSDMDLEIKILESKLEKHRRIKSGMMQNLLTGKIRLV